MPTETLKQALGWHFGGWQRKDLALAHRKAILEIVKAWPEFAETAAHDPEQAFAFWERKLPAWHHGFSATAFLLHLHRPDAFEIADRHRLDAMFELLKAIDHSDRDRANNLSLTDLQDYTAFFRAVFPKLPYGSESRVKLDRFLKMYGNRHAYKHVTQDFKAKEAAIKSFSWETVASKRFRFGQIANHSNADVLFACFLLTLEAENHTLEDLTIGDVIDRLPLGTGGLCNPASFNYALVSLFSGQKQRDFWIFENPEIKHAFTEQANNSTRDMRFYLKYTAEKISVNPKYVSTKG
ncbi:hypothetical protein M5X11_07985 [Paenibacillus alginolyticus]|uniref:hypothetical protein n=1 Tax=Paenibacillus alginolyticus TaxID=59839 RepID=UPI001FCC267E|nr:hypothetical protein [Paenibacillus alginolyticus]MCY9664896.1 hypothetical protein [Paenibacillus alginolyticus]